ncbi:YkvA family protein [Tellurirhabdus bombi]|uniref:YkvA family protein n=1 Tax=Tellurirhabdus bombi TaxID=2907205 RepID=UPI001F18F20F|nr:YkvA family protein [Tellurirhabdus bombi]
MANNTLLTRVLSSIFFRKSAGKASRYVRSSKSLFELINKVATKTSDLGVTGSYSAAKDQVGLLVRMVRAYAKGEYKAIPQKSLLSVVAVLLYFINPFDLILDVLPVIGFADDVALLLWLVNSIGSDIEKFRIWEEDRKTIKIS